LQVYFFFNFKVTQLKYYLWQWTPS